MSSGSIIDGAVKGVAVVCAIIVLLGVLGYAWVMFVFANDAPVTAACDMLCSSGLGGTLTSRGTSC
jgi:hypothetical protein